MKQYGNGVWQEWNYSVRADGIVTGRTFSDAETSFRRAMREKGIKVTFRNEQGHIVKLTIKGEMEEVKDNDRL